MGRPSLLRELDVFNSCSTQREYTCTIVSQTPSFKCMLALKTIAVTMICVLNYWINESYITIWPIVFVVNVPEVLASLLEI